MLAIIIGTLPLNTFCNLLLPRYQLWVFSYNAWWVWRTPDKRSETIPPYRLSPDPSDSQVHVGASSLQFRPLIFYMVQVRELGRSWQKLHFVISYTFLCWFWCLFWIVVLMEDPTTAHYKISSRRRQVLIFICLYLIESIIPCIWTRCPGPPANK